MPSLRCSVIVPTYNRERLLDYTLRSLRTQTLNRDEFEVLVVDDGSSDQTRAVALSHADDLNLRYFHQDDEGYRVALARNVGILHARAPTCIFIDSGVLLHSDCLRVHAVRHESAASPIAVIGYVFCFNKNNEDAELIRAEIDTFDVDGCIESFERADRWRDFREEFYGRYGDDFAWLPAPYLVLWTCNLSVATHQLKAVGMFDESFSTWGIEDVDLGYRLFRNGVRPVLDRQARSIHYPHDKSYDDNMRSVYPNAMYMAAKYDTPITSLIPDHEFFTINDIVRERGLPRCEDYLLACGRDPYLGIRADYLAHAGSAIMP